MDADDLLPKEDMEVDEEEDDDDESLRSHANTGRHLVEECLTNTAKLKLVKVKDLMKLVNNNNSLNSMKRGDHF